MLRQITMLRFKDDAPDTVVDDIGKGFAGLVDVVPGIHRLEFGPNTGLMDDTFHYVLVIDFESQEAWQAYQDHPKHVAHAKAFGPLVENAARAHYDV
jgi:heme-degrading monooxygenase HmoA